jgi:hypothetical protein
MKALESRLVAEFCDFWFSAAAITDEFRREPVILLEVSPKRSGERMQFRLDLGIYEIGRLEDQVRYELRSLSQISAEDSCSKP